MEARIVNPAGQVLPRGEVGELQIRGFTVMLRYANAPEQTAETKDTEGWLKTGDLARLLPTGHCQVHVQRLPPPRGVYA